MNSNFKNARRVTALVISLMMIFAMATPAFAETNGAPDCTYYFYAPESYTENGTPYVYWWIPSESGGGWPGIPMTSAPEIGENVYKVTTPAETEYIIFNNTNGQQTINIDVFEDEEESQHDGEIYVFNAKQDGQDVGEWYSVDPSSENYFLKGQGENPADDNLPKVIITSGPYLDKIDMRKEGDNYFTLPMATAYDEAYTVEIVYKDETVFLRTFYPTSEVYELDIYFVPETRADKLKQGSKYEYLEIQANYETIFSRAETSDSPDPGISRLYSQYDDADNNYTGNITYYFLAQDGFCSDGAPYAYWWTPSEPASWPGVQMYEVTDIGKNVFAVDAPRETSVIIFNGGYSSGYQTEDIDITADYTGLNNVGNMIYVLNGNTNDSGLYQGSWFSLDPSSGVYYRNSSEYGDYCFEDDYDPMIYVVNNPQVIAGESAPSTDPETADVPEGDTVFFRADGELFGKDSTILFYIWDETTGMCASKNGWTNTVNWGSKKQIRGTKVEGTDDLFESYTFDIPEGHKVYLIVHDYNTNNQTCNLLITEEAFGDTVYITGNMIENPIDLTRYTIEAAFENTDNCGTVKTLSSSCSVIGRVFDPRRNYASHTAEAINRFFINEGNVGGYYNYDNITAAMDQLNVSADDVWQQYKNNYGNDPSVYKLLFNEVENIDDLHPFVVVEYTDTMDMALSYDDEGRAIFYVDIPMDEVNNYYDVMFYNGEGDNRWEDYGNLRVSGVYRLNYDYFNNSLWWETIYADFSGVNIFVRYVYVDANGNDAVGRITLHNIEGTPIYTAKSFIPQSYTEYDFFVKGDNGIRSTFWDFYIDMDRVVVVDYDIETDSCNIYTEYGGEETPDEPDEPVDPIETSDEPSKPEEPDEPVDPIETSDEPSKPDDPNEPVYHERFYGDVTGDGIINSADAFSVLRCSSGYESYDSVQLRIGDVDGDGEITSVDALIILRFAAGKEQYGRMGLSLLV